MARGKTSKRTGLVDVNEILAIQHDQNKQRYYLNLDRYNWKVNAENCEKRTSYMAIA